MKFSVYHGTAMDTSILIDHIGSYIFLEEDSPIIIKHMVIGFSLGGHAAWQLFFNEPQVTTSVVIVGCPDYARGYLLLLLASKISNENRYYERPCQALETHILHLIQWR